MTKSRSIGPENWGLLYAAFAYSQGIGLITYWALPIITSALMSSLGLSAQEAGLLGTIEFAGLLGSTLLISTVINRGRRRIIGLIAVTIVVGANLVCGLFSLDTAALAIVRFVAGIGAGLALAVGNATIANAQDTQRFSGHLTIALVALMVIVMPVLGRLSEIAGASGVFLGLAGIVIISGLSWIFLPDGPPKEGSDNQSDHASQDGLSIPGLLSMVGFAVLAVALLFGARDTLPWLVAEQLGADAGMSTSQVGDLLSLMFLVSILGPAFLVIVVKYFSARFILAVSMTLTGLFAWMFTVSDGNATVFSTGIIVWATIYFMAFAQLNAVAALIDRSGRLVSAVGSFFIGGIMIAPVFGGYLLEQGGYAFLGYAELVLTGLILVIVLWGIRTLPKTEDPGLP